MKLDQLMTIRESIFGKADAVKNTEFQKNQTGAVSTSVFFDTNIHQSQLSNMTHLSSNPTIVNTTRLSI